MTIINNYELHFFFQELLFFFLSTKKVEIFVMLKKT